MPLDPNHFPRRRSSDLADRGDRLQETIAPFSVIPAEAGTQGVLTDGVRRLRHLRVEAGVQHVPGADRGHAESEDRKSTRLNSSHSQISYAVFCLKKKND